MKSNNLDDIIKKRKTSNTSFYFKIAVIVFAMFVLLFIPFFISNLINTDNKSYEIKTNGEQYGTSNFFKYQEKIYVFTLNDGMQALENVDIETFKTLNSGDYYTKNIGLDKNNVYFGNVIISDLVPNKLKVIGNGYYTDGTNSYFFSPFSELDKESSNYIYPYKKIENAKNLKAYENLELFAVDGDNVYYKGEILKNTDLNTLKIIDKNNEYFADKENVYYRSKLLPIKNSGKLKIVSSEQGDTFLYDEASGYVFIGDYTFDKEKAPYKVIGNNGTNLYNLIFIGKDGIYYYDSEKKKQLKAGDNIFVGNIEEIAPNIFSDDENIYYLDVYEEWAKKKVNNYFSLRKGPFNGELISRNTRIRYLDKKTAWENDWKKVADIYSDTNGSIWKKGNKYYYFDIYGFGQSINKPIYEITDKEVLDYLLNFSKLKDRDIINLPDKIRSFISEGKLIALNGEVKMTATIHFIQDPYAYSIPKIIFISIAILIGLYGKYRKSKFSKK